MKKNYFSLRHIVAFVLLLLAFVIHGCQKESVQTVENTDLTTIANTKLIANAKAYFETNVLKTDLLKTNALDKYKTPIQLLTKTVNWDSAYTQTISLGKIVVLPILYKESARIKVGPYELPVSSLTRLFIYKNKKGEMCTEVVTRIPDTTYLNNNSTNKIFSGIINVWDWQSNYIKGYVIKEGISKPLGAPEFRPDNGKAVQLMKLKPNGTICTSYEWESCGRYGEGPWNCQYGGTSWQCFTYPDNPTNTDNDGPTGGDYGGGGGNSSGSGNPTPTISNTDIANATYIDDGKPAIDPVKFINCFTDGKTASQYKITLYVDQPKQGSNDQISMTSYGGEKYITPQGVLYNVGHAFVGFQKINTDNTSVTQVMGFYPETHSWFPSGAIKDDGGHGYSVSYTRNVSASEFNSALNVLSNQNSNVDYVLSDVNNNEFNCIDAALTWTLAGGISLPTSASRGVFRNSPGDYGQALRNVNGSNATPGYAPNSHGACN